MGYYAAAAMAVTGAIGGSQKDKVNSSGSQGTTSEVFAAPASAEEERARAFQLDSIKELDSRLKSIESSPVLSNLDKLMQEMGMGPTQARIQQAQSFAQDVFAPRQVALDQSMADFNTAYAQRAAQMGRSSADPILAAKMAQERIRQQQMLAAEQGSFAAQEAINAPQRQFANQFGAMNNLSQAAIQNRQAVFSMGSEFANSLQQYRLATAKRTDTTNQFKDQYSGGGLKGAIAGSFQGWNSGMSMGGMGGMGGGQGGGMGGGGTGGSVGQSSGMYSNGGPFNQKYY